MADEHVPEYVDKKALVDRQELELFSFLFFFVLSDLSKSQSIFMIFFPADCARQWVEPKKSKSNMEITVCLTESGKL